MLMEVSTPAGEELARGADERQNNLLYHLLMTHI